MRLTNDSILQRGFARAAFAVTVLSVAAFVAIADADGQGVKEQKDEPRLDATLTLSAQEGLPKPDELYDRYIEAMGGKDAIQRHKSYRASGQWRMQAMGMEGSFRMYAAEPSNMLIVLDAPGMGEIRSGYDGEVGWTLGDVVGTMLMEEQELADMKIDADFFYPITYRNHFVELRTIEETEFEEKKSYHVRGKRRTGDEISIYFDQETGMMIGTSGVRTSEHGAINMTVIYSDFQEAEGVTMPRVMRMKMPDLGIEQHFRTEEFSYGDVDPSVFEIPEPIKRLVERRRESEQNANEADDTDG